MQAFFAPPQCSRQARRCRLCRGMKAVPQQLALKREIRPTQVEG